MLDSYDDLGEVRVNIVTFETEGYQQTSGWVSVADAMGIIDDLDAGGGTNYDEGLMTMMENFVSDGSIVGSTNNPGDPLVLAQNVSYFMTDGEPTAYQDWENRSSETYAGGDPGYANDLDDGIQGGEEVAWINFLQTHNVHSYAYAVGSALTYVDAIAYNGKYATDTNAVLVDDLSDFDDMLEGTVRAPSEGNIVGAGFGADGHGNIDTITIDSIIYTYDASSNTVTASDGSTTDYDGTTHRLTIDTNHEGTLILDVVNGDYLYTPPLTTTNFDEDITFTFFDADGDISNQANLTLEIRPLTHSNYEYYNDTAAANQEIDSNISSSVDTDSGDDWVHVNSISGNSTTVNTFAGDDLISVSKIENATVNTGDGEDRIYLDDNEYDSVTHDYWGNPTYTHHPAEAVKMESANVDMGDGNDIFVFKADLTNTIHTVKTTTINMGAGKDVLVFAKNSATDFNISTNQSGTTHITSSANANIDFTLENLEHIYFEESDNSYKITNGDSMDSGDMSSGIVIDGMIQGLAYETSSGLTGYTRSDGTFDYLEGDTVSFSIGNVILGELDTANMQDDKIFLQDLAGTDRTDVNDEYVENMAVLLQSLDSDEGEKIVITEEMHEAFSDEDFDLATISEEDLAAIIEETGREAVSEDDAMEHVQDMLVEYGDMDEEDFDERTSDDEEGVLALEDEEELDMSALDESDEDADADAVDSDSDDESEDSDEVDSNDTDSDNDESEEADSDETDSDDADSDEDSEEEADAADSDDETRI